MALLMSSSSTNSYSHHYDEAKFQTGFKLIEESTEKADISQFLLKIIKPKQSFNILDLGGGSGAVWKLILDQSTNDLKVQVVDSSEEQHQKALQIAQNCPNLSPIKADVIDFLNKTDQKFDLITCIHFLAGLPDKIQQQIFSQAQKLLNDQGIILIIQPNPQNPLSLAKVQLKTKILNQNYQPSYIKINSQFEAKIIHSKLSVGEKDLINLGYFLLGSEYTGNKDVATVELIKSYATQIGDKYQIELINDFLIWRKND